MCVIGSEYMCVIGTEYARERVRELSRHYSRGLYGAIWGYMGLYGAI